MDRIEINKETFVEDGEVFLNGEYQQKQNAVVVTPEHVKRGTPEQIMAVCPPDEAPSPIRIACTEAGMISVHEKMYDVINCRHHIVDSYRAVGAGYRAMAARAKAGVGTTGVLIFDDAKMEVTFHAFASQADVDV